MAKLGTKEYPICFHTQTEERIVEIVSICQRNGWEFIAKVEPDEPEDIREVEYMLNPSAFEKMPRMRLARIQTVIKDEPKISRNDPCPCGSGLKYKKCCMNTK